MNAFIALVRKEYWENNKSLLWLPLVLTVLTWLGCLLIASKGVITIEGDIPKVNVLPFLALPFFLSAGLAAITYCGNSLNEERRDRSILFWRSLPVSDMQTVMAKACTVLVLLPAISFSAALIAQLPLALLMTHLGVQSFGEVLAALGKQAGHFLWLSVLMAPFYGAMMLLSACTQRPLLWMLLGPLLLFIGESVLLDGHPVSQLLFGHLAREIMLVLGSLIAQPILVNGAELVTTGAVLSTAWTMVTGVALALIFWALCAEIRRRRLIKD
ncbi:hypothetical protein [Gallaecimonas pentaromativorans]|uniref:hypothetical protein n=1 Tax=Gallaecimonas pentaromativorans TaxID=584787 RepID=UPI003A91697A